MKKIIVTLLAVACSAAGCAEVEESSGGSGSNNDGTTSSENSVQRCGTKATDDCTPVVGPKGKVRVDALTYRLLNASAASTIGDPNYFGETANGIFVILNVKVLSNKDESATLGDGVFKLELANGNTYDPDNAGTIAAIGEGQEPFLFESIGPDSTLQGNVVFDVPPKALRQKPKLRIGELGFGSTHAYIRLPALQE